VKVFITGATGFLGRALQAALVKRGDTVVALTRNATAARAVLDPRVRVLEGDPQAVASYGEGLDACDAVVHLAGESLGEGRWTAARKERIVKSRVGSARALGEAMAAARTPPRVLLGGSAVGYYGGSLSDTPLDEGSPAGQDYLAGVCVEWEAEETRAAAAVGARLVLLRTGVVLGRDGGALDRLVMPFRMHAGGVVGSGRQWVSWIHLADWVTLTLHALDGAHAGAMNLTAPNPVTMGDLARAIGARLRRAAWAPVRGFVLRVVLGQMSEMVLTGQRALPRAAVDQGFRFQFSTIDTALADLLG
jgi:uncharacterized protein (TIGR01777 family)